jgi:hypothetical protein
MFTNTIHRSKRGLLILAVALCFLLAACSDQYLNNFNSRIDTFNNALNAFNKQVDAYNKDNTQFANTDWQSKTKQDLADLNAAAKVLASTDASQVPSQYANIDAETKQIANETEQLVTIYNQAIDQQDTSMVSQANAYIDTITSLIGQINAEMQKINGQ